MAVSENPVYHIDLVNENNHHRLNLDSVFHIISLVKLETTADAGSYLMGCSKAKIVDSLFYATDDGSLDGASPHLKVFDLNGKFIRLIGGVGEGPGEYTDLNDFEIKNDTIRVLTTMQQLIEYNLTGNHLATHKINMFAWHFASIDDGYVFFKNYNTDNNYNLALTSKSFNIVSSAMHFDENPAELPSYAYTGFVMELNKDILCSEAFSPDVYVLKQGELIKRYEFDFGKDKKPDDVSLQQISERGLAPAHLDTRLFQSRDFLFFRYFISPRLCFAIYDTNNNKLYPQAGFEKSYLSYIFTTPVASIDQNTFISVIPTDLVIYAQRSDEFMQSVRGGNPELYKMILNYDNTDNALMITYAYRD